MTGTRLTQDSRPYHHGDLQQVLLCEAERLLEQDGVDALSLRAIARAAGVSHAAPRNHFGDKAGLLSELAAQGFVWLQQGMAAAVDGSVDPRVRLRAIGRAYVQFALRRPGLFTLMFRDEHLDLERPALLTAMAAMRSTLQQTVGARVEGRGDLSPLIRVAQVVAARAIVHGFAVLMLDGRLADLMAAIPGLDTDTLFDAMMDSVSFAAVDGRRA